MAEKSKILIIGGTGYIGKFIVEASVKSGHPTFALVRESTVTDPAKSVLVDKFKSLGVTLVQGDVYDHEGLVKAIKQVDVVISAIGHTQLVDQYKILAANKEAGNVKGDVYDHEGLISDIGNTQLVDQYKILAAIKEAGNVKRFFPSEFGSDVDRVHAVGPIKTAVAGKVQFRRAVEAEGIPYTYVTANLFAGYLLPSLAQPGLISPPRDKVVILGDGHPKAIFNNEDDIAAYTIKAVDDPRTLNKILYINPPNNIISFNDLVSLWEKKIGQTLERISVPEDQVLKNIEEAPVPVNFLFAIGYSVLVKGDHTNFEIEPSFGVEASELYPDVKYTTVDEYLNLFV